jgi:alpha-amylase
MTAPLRFSLVLHNHQPVGNFDDVFQRAYEQSYRPFLDVFEPYSQLRIALHTSGSLIEWLDRHQSEYLDRIAALAEQGRIEVVGGAFYEPILSMLPSRDRIGQIRSYTEFLKARLGATVRGMWVAERVWEPSLVRDLADAGIEYTLLDDFHFRSAGLSDASLRGYYLTEDDGRLLAVFPGSERLRYIIPFGDPSETIRYLGDISDRFPGAVVTFADDGEKFGTWPETYKHVYEEGWLRRFFDALVENASWLSCTTPSEILENRPPLGKVYLPDASYREMTEWALPADQLIEYEQVRHELEHDPRWPKIAPRIRGGLWRNFKVKYPESDEMYARMMQVSRRLAQTSETEADAELLRLARTELYRGQCNCSYWHGAFGGIYLPHLRNAVYNHLIAADNLIDQALGKESGWIEATSGDFNFDARQEVRLANDKLFALLAPSSGGQIYELDVRTICHNLLATLQRRPEAYHRKILNGPSAAGDQVASIHDRVVFKQEGLDQRLQYDDHAPKSLIDHFLADDATADQWAGGQAEEFGDFVGRAYETKIRKNPDRIQVVMNRSGHAFDLPITITKGVTLASDGQTLEIAYLLEGLPQDRTLHFAVEFNFAGMPSGADDRYFHRGDDERLGQLDTRLNESDATQLGLVDEWLGIDVRLTTSGPTNFWTYPIETVSQSEGGFELVHQSVVVVPHWRVRGDAQGRWSVTMSLDLDTSLAESRMQPQNELAAT